MAKIDWRKILCLLLCSWFSQFTLAQQSGGEIPFYKPDNTTNQIPYFDNRFRIDAQLEEIKLIFYRKSGSQPIILVRPDGTKLKINDHPKDSVEWFDDRTFDMIRIKKPMPGPWQAIGQILPNSRILVVSDVKIEVEPLPEILLSGETIKVTGRLLNGEHALNDPAFRDVVNLDVDFFSTNNKAYDNFGAVPIKLTTFRDDGYELDEYAKDGVYTGEFDLDFAPGEWLPTYIVKMPMATRELQQKPVILSPNPISISVDVSDTDEKPHKAIFAIDGTLVDVNSVIFQGKFTFPDQEEQMFSITTGRGKERNYDIEYQEPGIHRINVNAFGKTLNGREFRLVVTEYVFNVERKETLLVDINAEEPAIHIPTVEEREAVFQAKLAAIKEEKRVKEEKEQQEMMIIIGIANLIIIIGAILFYILRIKRKKKNK